MDALKRDLLIRWTAALAAGSLAGLAVSVLDARWANAAAAKPPAVGASWLAAAGLNAPLALGVGVAIGALALLLHPVQAPSLSRLNAALNAGEPVARGRRAGWMLLGGLSVGVWLIVTARVALRVFTTTSTPAASGAAVGLAAGLTAMALGAMTVGGGAALGKRLAGGPSPIVLGIAGLAAGLAVVAVGVASGTTGGTGGTRGVFGVLKRDELDLRALGLITLCALSAYSVPAALVRIPWPALLGLGLLPLGLTGLAAKSSLAERRTALTIERGAPLAKLSLARLRKLGDSDGDGASALFGGGDCAEGDPTRHPAADDVPGNGIDEDCSGKDAVVVKLDTPKKEVPKDAKAWLEQKLPKPLNVILITIDTLRWDLGYAGNPRKLSPNLDRFAERSVVFDNAYSLASYTGKSVGPMLIGKYTSETHRGWSHFNSFSKQDTFIQERAKAAGYRTLSVQGHWYFKENTGLGRGFDVLDLSAAPKALQMAGDRTVNSDKLTDAAIGLLKDAANTAGPFYLWVHYLDPHADYVEHDDFPFGKKPRELYDGEVAFVDKHVGRLIDHIRAAPWAKNTAIALTSDHGEAFGEHGLMRHGFEIWEELVRVPLMFSVPGAKPHRVKQRRGAVDLAPTLAELMKLKAPTGEGADFMSGESLVRDIMQPPGHEVESKIVFVDMSAGPNNQERQAFIENDHKLIATGGRALGLYDLSRDPGEKNDLLDDAALKEKYLGRYKAFRKKLRAVKVRR